MSMQFGKKIIFLLFIFLIPVSIILFLNFFGESQFDVPVYYQNGVNKEIAGCIFDQGAHQVPDFELAGRDGSKVSAELLSSGLNVFHFEEVDMQEERRKQVHYEIERCFENLATPQTEQVKFLSLVEMGSDKFLATPLHTNHYLLGSNDGQDTRSLMQCGLVVSDSLPLGEQFVLVDWDRQIRGYYHALNEEEVDRLIVEMKIILENKPKNKEL